MTGNMDAPVTPQATGAKQEWQPPKLTELGDAATLTEASSNTGDDGTGSS
jgi:hypothetical protein